MVGAQQKNFIEFSFWQRNGFLGISRLKFQGFFLCPPASSSMRFCSINFSLRFPFWRNKKLHVFIISSLAQEFENFQFVILLVALQKNTIFLRLKIFPCRIFMPSTGDNFLLKNHFLDVFYSMKSNTL